MTDNGVTLTVDWGDGNNPILTIKCHACGHGTEKPLEKVSAGSQITCACGREIQLSDSDFTGIVSGITSVGFSSDKTGKKHS